MKKEVKLLGLSYSQSQIGSYIAVLSNNKGNLKLPIIIKPIEAQRIALEVEGIKPPRNTSFDIIKEISQTYVIDMKEVFIYSLLEGIFYTKIIVTDGDVESEIECSVGDAIAIAIMNKCPIYITNEIIKEVGIAMDDEGKTIDDYDYDEIDEEPVDEVVVTPALSRLSVEDLEVMLNEALKNEEFEIAAELRDRIKEIK